MPTSSWPHYTFGENSDPDEVATEATQRGNRRGPNQADAQIAYLREIVSLLEGMMVAKGSAVVNRSRAHTVPVTHFQVPHSEPSWATDLGVFPAPAGKITVDFRQGRVVHEGLEVIGDAPTFEDRLGAQVSDDPQAESLHSVYFQTDSYAKLAFVGTVEGHHPVVPSQGYPFVTEPFTSIHFHLPEPAYFHMIASTRADAPVSGFDLRKRKPRKGEIEAGEAAHDTWEDLHFFPYHLDDLINDHLATTDTVYDHCPQWVGLESYDSTSIIVENTSTAANDIDIRVEVAENPIGTQELDETPTFYLHDTNMEELNVGQGDHAYFKVGSPHQFVRVRIRNSTNTEAVNAEAHLNTGGF